MMISCMFDELFPVMIVVSDHWLFDLIYAVIVNEIRVRNTVVEGMNVTDTIAMKWNIRMYD